MARKKMDDFMHISRILPSAMGAYGGISGGDLTEIWQLWHQAVGTPISENTKPVAFKGKLLIVHVNSSPWVHHLQFLKEDIIRKVNHTLGKVLVDDIKFRVGPI